MEGREREEEESSLPPDYVSLAQLQERWMQKQREKKMRAKQEEEKKIDGREKVGRGSVRGVVGRRVGKNGGEMGVIEEKGKRIVIGGFENGEENKIYKRNNNRRLGKMKSAGDEGKGEEVEKEKVRIEKGIENEGEIVPGNGLPSVAMVEVLPRNGVKGEIPDVKRMDLRGGLGKNGDNRGSLYKSKKKYGGRFNELKQNEGALAFGKQMEDEKGDGKKWRGRGRGRGRNGKHRKRDDKLKDSTPDVLNGNEVESESEKKAEDAVLEVFSEKCSLSGRDSNGVGVQSNNESNKTKEDVVEGDGSTDDRMALEVLPRNGVKGEIPDVKRMDFRDGLGKNDDNQGSFYRSKKEYGGRVNELKPSEGTLASAKKMDDEKGDGKKWRGRGRGRNGEYGQRYDDKLKENTPDILKGTEVESESEKKGEDEMLEVFNEQCGLSGRESNGVGGQSNNESNKTKEDVVEGEGLTDDRMALEKKVDHEVSVAESAKNGKKRGVGKGYRGYGNWGGYFGEGRRYTVSRGFEDSPKMRQRESHKMWVKKEEKPGADTAEVGSSGISVDQE